MGITFIHAVNSCSFVVVRGEVFLFVDYFSEQTCVFIFTDFFFLLIFYFPFFLTKKNPPMIDFVFLSEY